MVSPRRGRDANQITLFFFVVFRHKRSRHLLPVPGVLDRQFLALVHGHVERDVLENVHPGVVQFRDHVACPEPGLLGGIALGDVGDPRVCGADEPDEEACEQKCHENIHEGTCQDD